MAYGSKHICTYLGVVTFCSKKRVQKDKDHDWPGFNKIWHYKNGGWQLVFIMHKLL
jgi:hypothetical protein